MIRLLEGARVVECSLLLSGCSFGSMLADLGADVIKIEPPPAGDYIREVMGALALHQSPVHLQWNKNKRSLMLDLKASEGKEIFWKLLEQADVFIDGFIVGACDRLGIGYQEQQKRKPDIIYCQYSGYGARGPYARIPTHGRMMQAAAGRFQVEVCDDGLIRATDASEIADGAFDGIREGAEPTAAGAIHAAFYTAAALYRRAQTGEGCYIDVAASDAVIASAWHGAIYAANAERIVDWNTMPTAKPGSPKLVDPPPVTGLEGAKYFFYETRDKRLVMFACIEHKWWEAFCEAVDRPELIGERDDSTPGDFALGDADLYFTLREIFLTRTRGEWLELAAGNDLPIGPAHVRVSELIDDPQLRTRNILVDGYHPHAGPFTYVGSPAMVEGQPYEIRRPAPLAGEHSVEVLEELGYDETAIEQLRATGVIVDPGAGPDTALPARSAAET